MEAIMNWEHIGGKWKQVKGSIRENWGKLTDDDIDVIAGKRDRMLGKLQERYGYTKERAESAVDDWIHSLDQIERGSDASTRSVITDRRY